MSSLATGEACAHEVRQVVRQSFADLGIADDLLDDLNETILVDDGSYRGRSYQTAGYSFMGLVAAGLLQFYHDSLQRDRAPAA